MERSFAGRGPTLQQLLQATAAEKARKAAAVAQVNQVNSAAANTPVQQQVQQAQKTQQVQQAQQVQKVQQAQAQQAQAQQAQQVQQTQQKAAQQASSALQISRFARRSVVDPNSKWAVHGKSIDEHNAEAVKAQAAASLANVAINNSLVGGVTKNTTYYDVDASLADVYKQAAAAGVSISKPASYGKTITDASKAQAIIDNYLKAANTALAAKQKTAVATSQYYDIDSNLNSMYRDALAQGVKVNAPTLYGQTLKTEAAARAAQQKYSDYLDTQYNAYNAAAAANAKVTVYDDLGRQQTISQKQLAQMQKAASNQTWRENYTILPIEVANSKADWWINSNGLYEWTPVTAGDKAELARQNKQREQFHQAPKTTLTAGASPSDEYSKQWYSTGGNTTQVARNAKLAALKASSSVNSNATAKTGTAQQQKAVVLSKPAVEKKQAEAQAAKKAAVTTTAAQAEKASQIAVQAKQEATAKQKAADSVKAAAAKSLSMPEKAALKQEAKALQKVADQAKAAEKAATKNATATKELAKAAEKAASAPAGSKTAATAAKNLTKAAATAAKTQTAAAIAGVQDHTGEILLKDGTWIAPLQKKGNAGKGESNLKIFNTTAEYQALQSVLYEQKKAGKTVANTLNPNYAAALKANQQAAIDAQKAANTYKLVHGTLNNFEIVGKSNPTELNMKIIGAADASGLQYVQTSKSVYDLQKIANRKISSTTLQKAAEGNQNAINRVSQIEGARKWFKENQIALDAKVVAATPITSKTSAADKKYIEAARENATKSMKFAEKTSFLSEIKNNDVLAERAYKEYKQAIKAADTRYNVIDEDSFIKESMAIQKATAGMTEAQKQKYLLDKEASTLPASGKASDLWTFLNTDLTKGLELSWSGIKDGKGGIPALKVDSPLKISSKGVKWDDTGAHVDQGLVTQMTKPGSTSDALDNIARKQVAGEQLTATETALLAQLNGGYKQGKTSAAISAKIDSATAATQQTLQGMSKNYKAGDKFLGVPLTSDLAEWANILQTGSVNAVGIFGGTLSAVPKIAGYTASQAKNVNSVSSAKSAGSNILMSGGIVASTMGRGMAKQAAENPKQFVVDMALAQAVFSGAGKAVGGTSKAVSKTIAYKTGITRAKTLGSDLIPYKEAGTILDALRYNKKLAGAHASNIRDPLKKEVYVSAPGNTIHVEPGTFGAKGRFATLSDEYVDPHGKYFNNKDLKRFGQLRNDLKKTVSNTAEKSNIIERTTSIDSEGVVRTSQKFKNKTLERTAQKINKTKSQLKSVSKKPVISSIVQNQSKITDRINKRSPRLKEKVVDLLETDTVKLSKAQWDRIYKKFSEKGKFWDEYKAITEIAQRQADKLQRPVLIPSPKVAKGLLEAENEVFPVFPKKGLKINSREWVGKTEDGVDVFEVRYGTQKPLAKKSLSQKLKENREYNKQMVKAVDGKKYNLNYIKSYAKDANRRLGELYGNKLTRPDAYEGGAHGKKHTEQVGRNITGQKVTESAEIDRWIGIMHDITKVNAPESPGIPHAVAAAEAIRRGLITDKKFVAFYGKLSKVKQAEFVQAIAEHTTIKPLNRHLLTEWDFSLKKNGEWKKLAELNPAKSLKERAELLKEGVKTSVVTRPTTLSKALANADRMDLTRFGHRVNKRMTWQNLKKESPKTTVNAAVKSVKAEIDKIKNPLNKVTTVRKAKEFGEVEKAKKINNAELQREAKLKQVKKQYELKSKTSSKMVYPNYKEFNDYINTSAKVFNSAYTPSNYANSGKIRGVNNYSYRQNQREYKASYASTYRQKAAKYETKPVKYVSRKSYESTPKRYIVTPKAEYYKPEKQYKKGYTGNYTPKPSGYSPAYKGKYTPTPGGYPVQYTQKYTPSGGNYSPGPNKDYNYGGNYGNGGGYSGNYNKKYVNNIILVENTKPLVKKKKLQEQASKKRLRESVKLARNIKNRLGGLNSMFDLDEKVKVKTKPVKKSVKRTTRA